MVYYTIIVNILCMVPLQQKARTRRAYKKPKGSDKQTEHEQYGSAARPTTVGPYPVCRRRGRLDAAHSTLYPTGKLVMTNILPADVREELAQLVFVRQGLNDPCALYRHTRVT